MTWRPHPSPSRTILTALDELREHLDCELRKVRDEITATGRQVTAVRQSVTAEGAALGAQLNAIKTNQEKTMSALDALKAADAALQAEVATFLTDIATALSAEDPDIEQITSDINDQVAALQGGDPANATPPSA